MTPEEKKDKEKIIQACKLVKEVFPNMSGNVRFNLTSGRQKVNMNVGYSVIIDPDEYFEQK